MRLVFIIWELQNGNGSYRRKRKVFVEGEGKVTLTHTLKSSYSPLFLSFHYSFWVFRSRPFLLSNLNPTLFRRCCFDTVGLGKVGLEQCMPLFSLCRDPIFTHKLKSKLRFFGGMSFVLNVAVDQNDPHFEIEMSQ